MRITAYLLRAGVELSDDLLRNADGYRRVELQAPPDEGVSWQLYVLQRKSSPVRWLSALRSIAASSDELVLMGQSAGAVLLIAAHARVFGVTFGSGFHAVDQTWIEPDFGLRVAANSVDPKKVTLAEARGLGRSARNAVSKVPVPNEMFALRLATDDEWIRRVAGKVLSADFAVSVSGADSLRLNAKDLSLSDLPKKLGDVLSRYHSYEYQKYFPFLDYFRRLPTSSPIVTLLDAEVSDALLARKPDLGFAAPDEFNFYNLDEFVLKYPRRPPQTVHDLTPDNVYEALDAIDARNDLLNKVAITAIHDDDMLGAPRPLRQYVVWHQKHKEDSGKIVEYALTAGSWFQVAADYAEMIDETLSRVPDITDEVQLPEWDDAWLSVNVDGAYAEQRYNRHVSNVTGHELLDRKLFHGKAGQRVEVCDLLSRDKLLFCVKRLDESDTMIHLFEQGSVSAALMMDEPYRKFVLAALERVGGDPQFGRTSDWTFVFAIATSRPGDIKSCLPFFARASLRASLAAITDKGFKVALAKITRQ